MPSPLFGPVLELSGRGSSVSGVSVRLLGSLSTGSLELQSSQFSLRHVRQPETSHELGACRDTYGITDLETGHEPWKNCIGIATSVQHCNNQFFSAQSWLIFSIGVVITCEASKMKKSAYQPISPSVSPFMHEAVITVSHYDK